MRTAGGRGRTSEDTDEVAQDAVEDPERVNRATAAMFGMVKLDIAALEAAADGA